MRTTSIIGHELERSCDVVLRQEMAVGLLIDGDSATCAV